MSATSSAEATQKLPEDQARSFPCEGCGSDLKFNIQVQQLKCPHCGFEKEIDLSEKAIIQEQDLNAMLEAQASHKKPSEQTQDTEYNCRTCAGTVLFPNNIISTECPYCGSPVQKNEVHESDNRIPTDAVLPFLIARADAQKNLKDWVKGRWFAPGDFKERGVKGKFNGLYMPHWTFDALTFTEYRGERGENYTVKDNNGNTNTRTRWYPASGRFQRFFDDVLVCAVRDAKRKLMEKLEPWHLDKVASFNQESLAGYTAMTYEVGLQEGFQIGKERMDDALRQEIKRRIGGDKQRIDHLKTRYDTLTYKNLMLPVWMLAYRYKDKSYQVVVNASTGEVQGERPWSWWKIFGVVLLGLSIVASFAILNGQ
jgi:DNA-directed RNA polymerase subunit RPC12/RpoP